MAAGNRQRATVMANKHRGEIEASLDGAKHRLVLTLGALAELESAFGDADMLALATRFESGRLSANDCVKIIGAGLRGAGYSASDEDVAQMQAEGGAAGFVDVVARLLTATFGGANAASEPANAPVGGGLEARTPFPGTT